MTKCFDYLECGDPERCGREGKCRSDEAEKAATPTTPGVALPAMPEPTQQSIALPGLPARTVIPGEAGRHSVTWGYGHTDEALQAYAREAVIADRATNIRAQVAGGQDAVARDLPSNEELEALYNDRHYGHVADFAAEVLERWGGWQEGLLGYGGGLAATAAVAEKPSESMDWKAFAESLPAMIGRISDALGISEDEQATANGDEEILERIADLNASMVESLREKAVAMLPALAAGPAPVEMTEPEFKSCQTCAHEALPSSHPTCSNCGDVNSAAAWSNWKPAPTMNNIPNNEALAPAVLNLNIASLLPSTAAAGEREPGVTCATDGQRCSTYVECSAIGCRRATPTLKAAEPQPVGTLRITHWPTGAEYNFDAALCVFDLVPGDHPVYVLPPAAAPIQAQVVAAPQLPKLPPLPRDERLAYGHTNQAMERYGWACYRTGAAAAVPLPVAQQAHLDTLDAERYRQIRECARCDSKHGNGFSLDAGGRLKAVFAFRYWCEPEELDAKLDAFRSIPASTPPLGGLTT